MVTQNNLDAELKELKLKVQLEKLVVGTDRVLKLLRVRGVEKVFLAANCPVKVRDDVTRYAALVHIPVVTLPQTNEELGIFCKRHFFISVIGTLGE